MNKKETAMVLGILKAAYPGLYKDHSKEELESIVNLWTYQFKDDDANMVTAAVNALISTRVLVSPPNIGEVKAKIYELSHPASGLTEIEAWSMVSKAIRNGTYGSVKEFNKLPPEVQAAVGSPEQLKVWANMDEEAVETVVASNFMRGFKAHAARAKENAMLPGDVRDLIGAVADRFRLGEGVRDVK